MMQTNAMVQRPYNHSKKAEQNHEHYGVWQPGSVQGSSQQRPMLATPLNKPSGFVCDGGF